MELYLAVPCVAEVGKVGHLPFVVFVPRIEEGVRGSPAIRVPMTIRYIGIAPQPVFNSLPRDRFLRSPDLRLEVIDDAEIEIGRLITSTLPAAHGRSRTQSYLDIEQHIHFLTLHGGV